MKSHILLYNDIWDFCRVKSKKKEKKKNFKMGFKSLPMLTPEGWICGIENSSPKGLAQGILHILIESKAETSWCQKP